MAPAVAMQDCRSHRFTARPQRAVGPADIMGLMRHTVLAHLAALTKGETPTSGNIRTAARCDGIFEALAGAKELLAVGRSDGLVISLSPALADIMPRRDGERAEMVINNTWRVDPNTRRDANA